MSVIRGQRGIPQGAVPVEVPDQEGFDRPGPRCTVTVIIPTLNEHVLAFTRSHDGQRAVIFANFSETPQSISAHIFEQYAVHTKKQLHGMSQGSTIEPLDFLVFG